MIKSAEWILLSYLKSFQFRNQSQAWSDSHMKLNGQLVTPILLVTTLCKYEAVVQMTFR